MSRTAQLLISGVTTVAAHTLPSSLLVARRPPPGRASTNASWWPATAWPAPIS
jgi:hypothetical protein